MDGIIKWFYGTICIAIVSWGIMTTSIVYTTKGSNTAFYVSLITLLIIVFMILHVKPFWKE